MTKPAWKAPAINDFLENLFPYPRLESIKADKCSRCGKPAVEFKDEISRIEFGISGLCQICQDWIFAPPPDEDKQT